jgi:hypothetical protein
MAPPFLGKRTVRGVLPRRSLIALGENLKSADCRTALQSVPN